jgi:Zn-dependent peptidase ImmA (M78 family)
MIRHDIEQKAQQFLARHGVTGAPVPVEDMARSEYIQVVRSPTAGQESGFLLRNDRGVMIGINGNESPRRQRFTIAHELGHWLLHDGRPLIVDHTVRINQRNEVSSAASDQEEIDANAFAAALLMPYHLVNESATRWINSGFNTPDKLTQQLANEFAVSTQAMNWRLVNLGVYN